MTHCGHPERYITGVHEGTQSCSVCELERRIIAAGDIAHYHYKAHQCAMIECKSLEQELRKIMEPWRP